jgi:hypothetical protein
MKQYKSSTPRAAFAIAALVMSIITFGLVVVLPATINSGNSDARTQTGTMVVA